MSNKYLIKYAFYVQQELTEVILRLLVHSHSSTEACHKTRTKTSATTGPIRLWRLVTWCGN